jgi:hypothetical protein
MAAVPEQARASIDRVIGQKGTYISDDGVYRIILPREETTIGQHYQRLSPNLGLNSWAAFTSGVHHEAVLTGQFLLLDNEVNPVLDVVLDTGLDVTGLAESRSFEGPHLHTIDVTGLGSFPTLASAFRKGLDAMQHVQQATAVSPKRASQRSIPIESAIDPGPLDAVLSMKETVMAGVYKAAIGKRTLLNGELVGRETGMSTWVSVDWARFRTRRIRREPQWTEKALDCSSRQRHEYLCHSKSHSGQTPAVHLRTFLG